MQTKEELDNNIIYKNGSICYTEKYSFEKRKYLKGFRVFIEFEDIEYLEYDKFPQNAEFRLDLFILYEAKTTVDLVSKVLGPNFIFKQLVGNKFSLPINPEPEYNENSIYLNSAHTPVEVTFVEILEIKNQKVKIRFDLQIFGKYEDTLPYNLFTEKIILLDIINPK